MKNEEKDGHKTDM